MKRHPIDELLRAFHDPTYKKLEDLKIVIRHRGAPNDEKEIDGRDVIEVRKNFFTYKSEGEEIYIPAHRIIRIFEKPKYTIPIPKGIQYKIAKSSFHEEDPKSYNAIDFLVPVGTPVIASRSGKVIEVVSKWDEYGKEKEYEKKDNYIIIQHEDNTFARYSHFGKGKIVVKEGDEIKQGDLLGYTGLSGRMKEPHLCFSVFKIESIKIKFEEG